MAQRIEQVKTVTDEPVAPGNARTVREETVQPKSFTLARVIWFIAGVFIVLLALRFAFALLGANRDNGFVDLIYTLSYPFAAPFFGIFSYDVEYGVSRFELSTLVAMGIYALIAWGLARLVTIRHPQNP